MASSNTPEIINFPFYWDLKAAINQLIRENIQARCGYLNNGLVYLEPPAHLLRRGCWCPDPSRPRRHTYTDCPNTRDPVLPVVSPGAVVRRCWHVEEVEQRLSLNHLFCFSPEHTVEGFMNWLMQPQEVLRGHLDLTEQQALAVEACVYAYDIQYPVDCAVGPMAEKFDALCRLLVFMRRREISYAARMAGSWHAERVHNLLEWKDKTFLQCLNSLSRAINMVAQNRRNREAQARRQRLSQ